MADAAAAVLKILSFLTSRNKNDGEENTLKSLGLILIILLALLLFILAAIPAAFLSVPFVEYEKISEIYETVSRFQEQYKNDGEAIELPWVEITAIAGVLYEDYTEVGKNDIEKIAEKFVKEEEIKHRDVDWEKGPDGKMHKDVDVWYETVYRVRSFEDVLDIFNLSEEDKDRAERYIAALENGGLKPPSTWKAVPEPGWVWPVPGYDRGSNISCGYGFRVHPITRKPNNHSAVDIAAREGAAVVSAIEGYVKKIVRDDEAFGNYIIIENDRYSTKYAHLLDIDVRRGEKVDAGERIGSIGITGLSTGPHLHFEVKEKRFLKDKYRNPLNFYNF